MMMMMMPTMIMDGYRRKPKRFLCRNSVWTKTHVVPSFCRSLPKGKVCCERPKISAHAHMHEGITYYILHIRTHNVRRKCHNEFCTRRVSVLSVFKTACTRLLYVYVFVCVCVVVKGITTQKRCRKLGARQVLYRIH